MSRFSPISRLVILLLTMTLLAVFAVACSGSSAIGNNEPLTYTGYLIDDGTGEPIPNATVSLNGIEAESLSDANGYFSVTGVTEEIYQTFTLNAPGYEPMVTIIDTRASDLTPVLSKPDNANNGNGNGNNDDNANENSGNNNDNGNGNQNKVRVKKIGSPLKLDVHSPQDKSNYCLSGSTAASVSVKGMVSLNNENSSLKDVLILIDVSDSANRVTNFDIDGDGALDTVLQAELAAARELVRQFDSSLSRLGVVKFARYTDESGAVLSDQTRVVLAPTHDRAAIEAAIQTVENEGAVGGTDLAAGLRLSIQAFTDAGAITSVSTGDNEDGTEEEIFAERHIVVLTDGIPTLPYASGLTQESGDRIEAIKAAKEARDNNVFIHPVVILPEDKKERRFTTMPAVQAISGVQGKVRTLSLDNINQLPGVVAALPISGVSSVTVESAGQSWPATVKADGTFAVTLELAEGTHEITVSAHGGNHEKTISEIRTVYVNAAFVETEENIALSQTITEMGGIQSPRAKMIKKGTLYDLMMARYPNAKVLPAVPSLTVGNTGTVTVEFISRNAGWNSEVAYFVIDPSSPPASSDDILSSMSVSNSIFYMKGMPSKTYNSGTYVETLSLTPGSLIGFMIVPKDTLSKALNDKAGKAPLFSIPDFNPGGYDQFLSLWNSATSDILFAIEDISIAAKSDEDFNDIVLRVQGASAKTLRCSQ